MGAGDRKISVSDAAWLARVNDDTMRGYVRAKYGSDVDTRTFQMTWQEVADLCRAHSRQQPFPAWLLDADPTAIASSASLVSPPGERTDADLQDLARMLNIAAQEATAAAAANAASLSAAVQGQEEAMRRLATVVRAYGETVAPRITPAPPSD